MSSNMHYYFYSGNITRQSVDNILKTLPISGVFSVEESFSPIDAYNSLENTWAEQMLKSLDGLNDKSKENIYLKLDCFRKI